MNITNVTERAPIKPEKEKAGVGLIEKITEDEITAFYIQESRGGQDTAFSLSSVR